MALRSKGGGLYRSTPSRLPRTTTTRTIRTGLEGVLPVSFWSRVAEVLRLYAKVWPLYRLALVEAEALVWRHGQEGVEAARARERMADGSHEEWLHSWLVRALAERRYDLLRGLDVSTRYEVVEEWARGVIS